MSEEATSAGPITTAATNRLADIAGFPRKSKTHEEILAFFTQTLEEILARADAARSERQGPKITLEDLDSAIAYLELAWQTEPQIKIDAIGKPEDYFAAETHALISPKASFARTVKEMGYVMTADACTNCQFLVETITVKFLSVVCQVVKAMSARTTIRGSDISAVAENLTMKKMSELVITQPVAEEPKPSKAKASKAKAATKAASKAKAAPKASKAKAAKTEVAEEDEEVPVLKSPKSAKASKAVKAEAKASKVAAPSKATKAVAAKAAPSKAAKAPKAGKVPKKAIVEEEVEEDAEEEVEEDVEEEVEDLEEEDEE